LTVVGYSSLNLVLLGPPGSGKSTQARLLAETYQLPHISTNEMLRWEVEQQSPLGRQVEQGLERGELVSDRVMAGMILQRLDRDDCRRGFILDGYPRNVAQADLLDGILAELGRSIERVVLLNVPRDTGTTRLMESEADDHQFELADHNGGAGASILRSGGDPADAVAERFRVWNDHAPKLIDAYRQRGLLLEVNANQTEDRVAESVMQAVGAPVGA
jgi:adenylate kinase